MADHIDFGQIAEEFITQKYLANNYEILERNWRFHPLEIDIIAKKDDVLVIVEVKARAYDTFIDPKEAVNLAKKRNLVKAANEYMEIKDIDLECRFDIAIVIKKPDGLASTILIDAFEPFEL